MVPRCPTPARLDGKLGSAKLESSAAVELGLRIVAVLVVATSSVVLLSAALASLHWRYVHDSPLMIYAGFLVGRGAVPYRDFFDMNMPGTYYVMWVMGRVLGWDDLGFRVFDLLCLASISVSTFMWMRRFGKLAAFAASVAFPLWYLMGGPTSSLQREYIALVPFAGMLAVATPTSGSVTARRALLAGVLTGMAVLIKPQFLLLSLPVLAFLLQQGAESVSVKRRVASFLAGVFLPIGAMFVYLLCTGGLGPFVDIAVNYWPLYTHLTAWHEPIGGLRRFIYVVCSMCNGLMTPCLPMAVLGLVVLSSSGTQRRYVLILGGLLVVAAIYPALAGQFWAYHWMPFCYVALCLASLAARVPLINKSNISRVAPFVAAMFLFLSLSTMSAESVYVSCKGNSQHRNLLENGVPDAVCAFLSSHMKPGDAVQPLDWTGGAVHGMLMARAPLATRFIYDFHFYHHTNSPYIHRLRREFMGELIAKEPRFVVQVLKNKPSPTGRNTRRDFPELQTFLKQHYATAQRGSVYRILERGDGKPRRH